MHHLPSSDHARFAKIISYYFFHFFPRVTRGEMDAGILASQLDEFRQLLIGINEDVSSSLGPAHSPSCGQYTSTAPLSQQKEKEKEKRHHARI